MALTKVIGAGLGTVTEDQVFGGATPTVTIGDAGAEDAKIVFDGNAQDFYIGLDDSSDILAIGNGSDVGATRAIIVDANGIIRQPQQPAFSAKAGGSQTNIAVDASVDVVLGTEIFDQNADFASNTFTAPVTGKYSLNAHFYLGGVDSGADYIQGQITTSNRNYVQVFSLNGFDADFLYMPMTISVVADMDASDTAKLQLYQGGGTQQIDVDGSTYFTGYLLG